MIYSIPIVGWIVGLFIDISLGLPFWFVWTRCGIGAKFFYFLPDRYLAPSFWEVVGVFIVLPIVKRMLTPHLVNVEQTNKVEK